jgi:hypothetical protein
MSERLRHLQRQQTLLREHLAWIESEIIKESPVATSLNAAPPAPPLPLTSQPISAATDVDADALIERYAADGRQHPDDIRRGCLMIFGVVLFVLVGGVVAAWLVYYR